MNDSDERSPGSRTLNERYELIHELGRGAVSEVHLARDRETGQLVAIKTIRPRFRRDAETLARFEREARVVEALEHPNIVRTIAVHELDARTVAIVMQHVPGETLRDALRRDGALDFTRTTNILCDIAQALRYAHARGIVHRDVKPENIILEQGTGRALLADFGIARPIESESQLTITGATVGTPAYMSPEQIDGGPLDARSDIFSLGVVGWEMIAGRQPWAGANLYETLHNQKNIELPPLTTIRPDIPEPLRFAIEGALIRYPDGRWANANEFLDQLLEGRVPEETGVFPAQDASTAEHVVERHAEPATSLEPSVQPIEESAPIAAAPVVEEPVAEEPVAASAADAEAPATIDGAPPEAVVDEPELAATRRARAPMFSELDEFAPRRSRAPMFVGLAALLAVVMAAALFLQRDRRPSRSGITTAERNGSIATAGSSVAATGDSTDSTTRRRAGGPVLPRTVERALRERDSARQTSAAPAAAPRAASASATERADSASGPCASPALADQQTCLRNRLAESDAPLDSVYHALIAALWRIDATGGGSAEPVSVAKLRTEERAWLDTRDRECRARSRPTEGPLWAPARARCLGAMSRQRVEELSNRLRTLRGADSVRDSTSGERARPRV